MLVLVADISYRGNDITLIKLQRTKGHTSRESLNQCSSFTPSVELLTTKHLYTSWQLCKAAELCRKVRAELSVGTGGRGGRPGRGGRGERANSDTDTERQTQAGQRKFGCSESPQSNSLPETLMSQFLH